MGVRDDEELDFDWQLPTYQKLQHLRLYATQPVAEAAETAYSVAWRWGHNTTFGKDDPDFYERQDEYNEAEADLLHWIRIDLRIPEEIDMGRAAEHA